METKTNNSTRDRRSFAYSIWKKLRFLASAVAGSGKKVGRTFLAVFYLGLSNFELIFVVFLNFILINSEIKSVRYLTLWVPRADDISSLLNTNYNVIWGLQYAWLETHVDSNWRIWIFLVMYQQPYLTGLQRVVASA